MSETQKRGRGRPQETFVLGWYSTRRVQLYVEMPLAQIHNKYMNVADAQHRCFVLADAIDNVPAPEDYKYCIFLPLLA